MQLQIIEHFEGHFCLADNNEKLVDAFCGTEVKELSFEALEEHINSEEHRNALTQFNIEKLRKKSKSVTAKLDKVNLGAINCNGPKQCISVLYLY